MQPANSNSYGITHTGYATDMTEAGPLRYQLDKAGKPYQQTALNMGTFFAEPACIVTYESQGQGGPVSTLIIPLVGADSWCEEYYIMVGTDHQSAINRDWGAIIRRVRALVPPDTRRKAYSLRYTTEADDGFVIDRYTYMKYFDRRDQALAEARRLTDDAEDDNGTFVSAWFTEGDSPTKHRITVAISEMLYEDVPDA